MKLVLFVVAGLVYSSLITHAQTASSCVPAPILLSSYSKDAADLALGRIYAIHSPDTSSIAIPALCPDSVMSGLAAICNTGATIQADSVFRDYCIHSYPHGHIQTSLQVIVDTSYAWTHWWEGSVTTTGYGALDSFMARYGFTVGSFDWYLAGMPMAVINTGAAINSVAFADSLLHFPGVVAWYPNNSVIGVDNWIYYSRDTAAHFTFVFGWDDCLSGCINTRSWSYTVYNDCSVSLDSMYFSPYIPDGPVLPDCGLFPLTVVSNGGTREPEVYPNPSSDHVALKMADYTGMIDYTIMDMSGKTLRHEVGQAGSEIDIRPLMPGTYILKSRINGGVNYYTMFCKF